MIRVGEKEGTRDAALMNPQAVAAVRRQLIDADTAARVAETFKVLDDPTRIRIIHALSLAELCTYDLAAILGISESTTSHQLRMLRLLRLVKHRREGRVVYYSLDDDHIHQLLDQSYRHATEG